MKEITKQAVFKNLCPFVTETFDDCYCVSMDSRKIEAAIYYCGGNFEKCETYKKQTVTKHRKI